MITSPKTLYEMRQELHVSKSQIRTFLMCPQKYAYQYVLGKEWSKKNSSLCLGSAIHSSIANFYLTLANEGEPLKLKDLQDVFLEAWSLELKGDVPIDFNGKTSDKEADLGVKMLEVFHENIKPRQIEAVELPFSVPITDYSTGEISPVKLVGAFDLVEADNEGNMIISELKTSARKKSDGEINTELDPSIYSYALNQMGFSTNGSETLVRFDVLIKTKKPSLEQYYTTRNEKDHQKILSLIFKVLKAIETGIFYKNAGWQCPSCPFERLCSEDL